MKDPIEDIKRELRSLGATFSGSAGNGASRWLFPDGQKFILERKSGTPAKDAKVAKRKLDVLMTSRIMKMPTVRVEAEAPALPPPPPPVPVEVVEAPVTMVVEEVVAEVVSTPPGPMRERWTSGLSQLETYRDKLQAEMNVVMKRIAMLKSMEEYIDDKMFVETFRSVLPVEVPPVPQAISVPRPEPPKPDTSVRVKVSRDLIETAVSLIGDREFKVGEILDILVGDKQIDDIEHKRAYGSVSSTLHMLVSLGILVKTQQGRGKTPAFFQRAKKAIVNVTYQSVGTIREISGESHAQEASS